MIKKAIFSTKVFLKTPKLKKSTNLKERLETPSQSKLWKNKIHGAKIRNARIKTSYSPLILADY